MGSLLFGIESVILSNTCIDKLETIQSNFAKRVLRVKDLTANIFGLAELVLKSMRQRVYESKIKFYDWVSDLPESRLAHQALRENLSGGWDSSYIRHIVDIEVDTGIATISDRSERRSRLDSWGRERIRSEVLSKPSLSSLPLPSQGWKPCSYVCDQEWSSVLSDFRAGNTRLGNRGPGEDGLAHHPHPWLPFLS